MRQGLVQLEDPLGGMVCFKTIYRLPADELHLVVHSLRTQIALESPEKLHTKSDKLFTIAGGGSGWTSHEAHVRATSELVERQSAYCVDKQRVFTATTAALGSYAIDVSSLAVCSEKERLNSWCYRPIVDSAAPMRWIEGHSLMSGKARAIPLSLVYLYPGVLSPYEKIHAPISTGLAAHESMTAAITSAVLEVVERDALSIFWLQKIIAGRIDGSAALLHRGALINRHHTYHLLNISTDLDIPVVCCIRVDSSSTRAHTLVSCAAGFQWPELIDKTIRDISALSLAFRRTREVPDRWDKFTSVHHGATYMAHVDRALAFPLSSETSRTGWSLGSNDAISLTDGCTSTTHDQQLGTLIHKLDSSGIEAFAVDITSIEAYAAGLHVARVLTPALQPLPYRYATRYLGHPRLYTAPRKMGHRTLPESQINPYPLPFA